MNTKLGTILIIDDDEMFLTMMRMRLEAERFEVLTCKTGEDGVGLFKKRNPNLVVLDIMLPSMSSAEVFKQIKALDPKAKIITASAFTALTMPEQELMRDSESFYDKAAHSEKLIGIIKAALAIR